LKLDDWAPVNAGLIEGLRQALQAAEEGRLLRQYPPVDAKLRVLSLQNDTTILVPDFRARYRYICGLAFYVGKSDGRDFGVRR
jgi:hypothetical protein